MIKVKAVQDDSGHWYIIPNELCDEFINIMDDIEHYENNEKYVREFEDKFSHYRTGGDLNLKQLWIE